MNMNQLIFISVLWITGLAGSGVRAQTTGTSVRLSLPENSKPANWLLKSDSTTYRYGSSTNAESEAIVCALEKVKAASSDKERDAANAELRKLLVEQFDKDIQRRRKELDSIAAKLNEMQSLLQKRIESADKIIDLRAQVLIQDLNGLGWNNENPNAESSFGILPQNQFPEAKSEKLPD